METGIESQVLELCKQAKVASKVIRGSSAEERNVVLLKLASIISERSHEIMVENAKDIDAAEEQKLSSAMIDRLLLTEDRIHAMAEGVKSIANQREVVGETTSESTRNDGLLIKKQRVPLGVMAMIFESRPNVVIDCSALAIKSANAIILKGGKEAFHSNKILADCVREALTGVLPESCVVLLDSRDRSAVKDLLEMQEYVDVVIPRGGEGLIRMVYDTAKMPVIAHFKGLCHIYIHSDADIEKAVEIAYNAKVQRPGVCNAMETLLLHHVVAEQVLAKLYPLLQSAEIEVRGCERTKSILREKNIECGRWQDATEDDWSTEYLDKIVSIKVVENIHDAISHINQYGTYHTEVICARDEDAIDQFQRHVDASCVVVNASSRFNDGGELGLGAELGISTTKLHAYGPMGAAEMTTQRYLVVGDGHVRR